MLVEGRGQPHNMATLSMGKEVLILVAQEVGYAPELVWALCRGENLPSSWKKSQFLSCPVCNIVTISATLAPAVLSINQFSYSKKITKIMQHRDITKHLLLSTNRVKMELQEKSCDEVRRMKLLMYCPIITNYSQQDATFLEFIYFYRRSTCFRWFLRPSSGAHNCTYSFRYCRPILLLAATVKKMELQFHLLHGCS